MINKNFIHLSIWTATLTLALASPATKSLASRGEVIAVGTDTMNIKVKYPDGTEGIFQGKPRTVIKLADGTFVITGIGKDRNKPPKGTEITGVDENGEEITVTQPAAKSAEESARAEIDNFIDNLVDSLASITPNTGDTIYALDLPLELDQNINESIDDVLSQGAFGFDATPTMSDFLTVIGSETPDGLTPIAFAFDPATAGLDLIFDINNSLSFMSGEGFTYEGTSPSSFLTLESTSSVPEPTSILSLLALGTLGAASTLKRKLKNSKSTEKETKKVS